MRTEIRGEDVLKGRWTGPQIYSTVSPTPSLPPHCRVCSCSARVLSRAARAEVYAESCHNATCSSPQVSDWARRFHWGRPGEVLLDDWLGPCVTLENSMESRFKVSCAERYTLNTGGEGKCKKQKEMGESNVGGWNCTMRVCDMAPSIFLLSLSASERFVLFSLTAASLAYCFIIVNCPVCMSHWEPLSLIWEGWTYTHYLSACLFRFVFQ